jgi:hypothetical protein
MHRHKFASILGFVWLLLALTSVSTARIGGQWVYLGEANVNGARDRDNILVTGARGQFRAIQIRVERGPIQFDRVVVHFENGDSNPIRIAARIPAGGQTRVIDLPGNFRNIRSVEFWYRRATPYSPRPMVRLFGLR